MPTDDEITSLKQQLQQAIAAKHSSKKLLEERENLLLQIDALSDEASSLPEAEQDPAHEQIAGMKMRLRALDHTLDELEHASDYDIDALREALASRLQEHSPQVHKSYRASVSALEEARAKAKNLQELDGHCLAIQSHAERALATSQQIWRGGFLGFMLGSNPNKITLRSLDAIESSGKKSLELLALLPSLHANTLLAAVLQKWVSFAQESWTYRKLRAELPGLIKSLEKERSLVKKALHQSKQSTEDAIQARDSHLCL